jgi:hypothetical protein
MKALNAVYDLKNAPATFDYGTFLVISEMMRQLSGHESLNVTILADGFRNRTKRDIDTTTSEKMARITGIMMQLNPLIDTISGYSVQYAQPYDFQDPEPYNSPYLSRIVGSLFGEGASPNVMKAPEFAKNAVPTCDVTLTLRQSRHFPQRNVVLKEWYEFYNYLKKRGLNVLVVPDQEDITDSQKYKKYDWECYEPAAWNMNFRMALYEKSKLNICSSNGPTAMLYYTDCNFIQFDNLRGGIFTEKKWKLMHGVGPTKQLPWFTKKQRITWNDSTISSLKAEFKKQWDLCSQ